MQTSLAILIGGLFATLATTYGAHHDCQGGELKTPFGDYYCTPKQGTKP